MIVKSKNEWQMLTLTKYQPHIFMQNLGHWKIKLDVNKICAECFIYLHILREQIGMYLMYNRYFFKYVYILYILNP